MITKFLRSAYPAIVEVLIADGGSTDRTREIVKQMGVEENRIRLIDNPEKYQSYGLNRMIEVATGEIFLRADGHCFYADDYVEQCVRALVESGARNAGGAQRYKATNFVQSGVALAVKSFLGNGGAKYMDEQYEGFADTVFLGCFWLKDLKAIGGFSTENITNQDSELNLRLIGEFGECVYVSPEVKSWYYPRSSFTRLFKQYFRYGRGRFVTKTLHSKSSPFRSMAPFLFVAFILSYTLVDIVTEYTLQSPVVIGIFALTLLAEAFRIALKKQKEFQEEIWDTEDNAPSVFARFMSTVISIFIMQIGHFSGYLYQVLKRLFGNKGW